MKRDAFLNRFMQCFTGHDLFRDRARLSDVQTPRIELGCATVVGNPRRDGDLAEAKDAVRHTRPDLSVLNACHMKDRYELPSDCRLGTLLQTIESKA